MSVSTAAKDKLGTMGFIPIDSPTSAIALAKADSAQNVISGMRCNWGDKDDAIIERHDTWWIVGRKAPASGEYDNAPIGSLFFLMLADTTQTPVIYNFEIFIMTTNGWERLNSSVTANSHVILAAGTHVTAGGDAVEAITVTGCTVTDLAFVEICSVGQTAVTFLRADTTTAAGFITATLSADPGTDHKLSYMVIRAKSA